jgi:hypothetical protein
MFLDNWLLNIVTQMRFMEILLMKIYDYYKNMQILDVRFYLRPNISIEISSYLLKFELFDVVQCAFLWHDRF